MKLISFATVSLLCLFALPLAAQDSETQEQLKKATEAAKKMGGKLPDMSAINAMTDDMAKEEAKQKEAVKAAVESKEPATLPAWAPAVPQFTASGPATRQVIDGQPRIIQKGTSPLTPSALCDAWDAFKKPEFSHERGGSDINHHEDLYVNYRRNEDNEEVRLEAERKPGDKVTKVTISSPIRTAPPSE